MARSSFRWLGAVLLTSCVVLAHHDASSADSSFVYRYRQSALVDASAPIAAGPLIADLEQNRLYLGWVGSPSQFSPSVVDDTAGAPWNHPGTRYGLSVDLSKYGLSFNQDTGEISGTPTMSFIERDVVMTVTSRDGKADHTAPFKIGVSDEEAITPSPDMKKEYFLRAGPGMKLVTDAPAFLSVLGDSSYSLPSGIPSGYDFSPKSGILRSLADTPVGNWNKTIFVTDEFGRVGGLQMTMQIATALDIEAVSDRTFYDTEFFYEPHSRPLVAHASPRGVLFSALGLPSGLQIDAMTGEIYGALDTSVPWDTPFTINIKAVDLQDLSEDSAQYTIRTAVRRGYQYWRIADKTTTSNTKDVNGTMIWGCTNSTSFSDPQRGAVTAWKTDPDANLMTAYSFPDEKIHSSSGLLGTTCSFAKDPTGTWWKSWKFKEPVNAKTISVQYRWATNVGSAIKNPIFQGSHDGRTWVNLWTAVWSPTTAQNATSTSTRPN